MIPKAPLDQHSSESLEALARVIPLCVPGWPAKKDCTCKRCRKEQAWQNAIEQTDTDFENAIWGFTD